ncbi:hypothetical protein FOL47_002040 [Perkinsus chesapeaki]|uniref:Uncharacterized protein n=1 Tax=Perkinsus chesapeaki TaxID=330153 RepID=A0A7J6MFN9_PERCH|nr:hypothetical protein FOL47_002040 [Perkinsus chesapeaki]
MARPAGPKEFLCLRLAKLDACFDEDKPLIPGSIWEYIPPIQPGKFEQVKEFKQWLIRHRPIPYHGTNKHYSQGTFVIRKRKSDWGCWGFQLDFINCKVADEVFRAFWSIPVKADTPVGNSVTAPQKSGDDTNGIVEADGDSDEYDDSEVDSDSWDDPYGIPSDSSGYSYGRSTESEEIHQDRRWLETVACCEGTYSRAIVFQDHLYYSVEEDGSNLRWRGLKPESSLTRTIPLPAGEDSLLELGAVKGFLYIVGGSRKVYVLREGKSWKYILTFNERSNHVLQDALVDEDGLPYKIMYFQYKHDPFGTELVVWDRESGGITVVAPNLGLEVCKFLPHTGEMLGVGVVRDPSERIAVFRMDDGHVFVNGKEDYIFNYPGEVVSFEVDGNWRVTLIGDSMKYGCHETISFPLHFEWELSAAAGGGGGGELGESEKNGAGGEDRQSTVVTRAA